MLVLNVFPYAWAIDNLLESVRNPQVPAGGKRRHRAPGSLQIPAGDSSRRGKQNDPRGIVVSGGKNAAWVSAAEKASLQLHFILLLLSASAQVALCSAAPWGTQFPEGRQRGHFRGAQVVSRGDRSPMANGVRSCHPLSKGLSSHLVTAHLAKWKRNIWKHRQTRGEKLWWPGVVSRHIQKGSTKNFRG